MSLPLLYHHVIDWITAETGLPDCMLHMHAGMLLMLGTAAIFRKSLASPIPLAIVAAAELGNEIMDRLCAGSWQWPDTSMDAFNTLIWPTALFLYSRWRRARAKQRYELHLVHRARASAMERREAHRAARARPILLPDREAA